MSSERRATLLLWLMLVAFGLSYGLNYGVANHTFYLLPSVHQLHPELWQKDWLVTQTHHYHVVWSALASVILRLDSSGWLIALCNVATIALGMAWLSRLLKSLVSEAEAWLAMVVVLLIATGTRTGTAGWSYVFSVVFQPSALGALGVMAASCLLVEGRPLASGIALGAAGLFHANYLVLCAPVFGFAQLTQGRAGLWRRVLQQLGPSLLVLPLFLPLILATSSAPVVAEAQRVYQDIRSPHHYRVETFARELAPWLGWQLLGVWAGWQVFRERPALRRLLGLMLGFWLAVVPALLVCWALVLRPLIQLYPWRLTANCELLAQALLAAAVVARVLQPAAPPRPRAAELALVLSCLALILYGGFLSKQFLPFAVTASGLALVALRSSSAQSVLFERGRAWLPGALALLLVGVSVPRFARLAQSSSLLGGVDPGLQELCGWLGRSTPVDAVLLTPPDDENIRFSCRRAIVVDWKSAPMVPGEVLAWQRRIEDVTGRPLRHVSDLAGYRELDAARLQQLRAKYAFDYAIVRPDHEPWLGLEAAFRNERFVVYRLPPHEAALR